MPFFQDLKIAVRSLWRIRTLWFTVALTLALGIGANAAIFSVLRSVLLAPLANRDEDHLLYVRQSAPGLHVDNETFSVPEIDDLNHGLKSISQLGTFSSIAFTVVGLGPSREIRGGVVDGHYFDVMGLRPVLGRLLTTNDDGPNAAGAIVLTNRFWTSSLHSDPSVLGKTVRLESYDGARNATIVGVLQPATPYPEATEIIANIVTSPHHLSATMVTGREHRMTEVFARLAPGATLEAARAELRSRYASITAAHPETYRPSAQFQIGVTRMHDQLNSRANAILWILFAAAALLFVIACSNVANLVLARTVRRESELAVRSALGASSRDLRRSLLAESLVMCFTGVIAALLLAWPMVEILGRYAARFSVRAEGLKLDFTLVWFGIALAVVAAVFLAMVPRLPSGSASIQAALISGGGTKMTGRGNRRLSVFAVVQIAASFLLLSGAAILIQTLLKLEETRPPFDATHVLAVNLPVMSYGRTPEQINHFYREVQAQVSSLPGVEKASTGFSVPWRDTQGQDITLSFAAEGETHKADADDWRAKFRSISPGYFETLGLPVLQGRDFRDADKAGSERVVIISKSLANTLFPGQDAVNRELRWTDPVVKFIGISQDPRRIIGVVPDVDDENIIPAPAMTIYQPAEQEGWYGRLFVRAKQDPYALVPAVTRTIHDISAEQAVDRASTLDDVRAEVMTPAKLNAVVFGGFATVALLISIVGVAGVLAFSVSGRTREFGIRMAVGAQPRNILQEVMAQGLVIGAVGVGSGLIVGIAVANIVRSYVAQFQFPGVLSIVAAAVIIVTAAVLASLVPARRAARVNAVEALRAE